MADKIKRPTDPYSPLWQEYARQNPGLRRSLSAAVADDVGDSEIDLSAFVPESFKGEDGSYDTEAFRASFDEHVSFKAQADEAAELLPKEAGDYGWAIPEDHVFPEGFDPTVLRQPAVNEDGSPQIGEDGQPVMRDFDVNDMIKADDPDLPLLQAALHKHGAKPELMGDLASIMANREIANALRMAETHETEMKALGPNGQSRVDTVMRAIKGMVPPEQAKAVANGLTSADALKGLEAILKKSKSPPASAPGNGIDNATASIDERIDAGLKARRA